MPRKPRNIKSSASQDSVELIYSTGGLGDIGRLYVEGFLSVLEIKEKKVGWFRTETRGYNGEKKKKNIIVKSVSRNAELTSFTFYTSAVAHIINITVSSYSSSTRQRMGGGGGVGCRGEEESTGSKGGTELLPLIFVDSTDGACAV